MSNKIHTDKAPAAIGPYSQAVVVDRLIFTSGQIPLDPATGCMVGESITEQTHRVCQNLEAVLAAAGCRDLPPYSCRHTTATALAVTKNIAPQTVRKVMRWSTAKMLDRYAHPDQKDALKAVNRIKKAR